MINFLWCVFLIGVVLFVVLGYVWLFYFEVLDLGKILNYLFVVVVFVVCGLVEFLFE